MTLYPAATAESYFKDSMWHDENTFNHPRVYMRLDVSGNGHDAYTGADAREEMLELIKHAESLGYKVTLHTVQIYTENDD